MLEKNQQAGSLKKVYPLKLDINKRVHRFKYIEKLRRLENGKSNWN